ncbi:MAG: GGDEF domain-containing protein [Actinobacteria bacterium]|nr:GGDEF domain-containing protein [Actinomycetota bacterium]
MTTRLKRKEIRERSARRRELSAQARLAEADKRDEVARARDLAALARDQAAAARDLAMGVLDAAMEGALGGRALTGGEVVMRAADQRKRAAAQRALAAAQRVAAAEDRRAGAEDREQAARERRRALSDRHALARELAIAETDPLTGARTRAAGLTDLEREVDRARRTNGQLAVAYVDVIGLKALNDSEGHPAGDALLKRVVAQIKHHLRSYDLIIRLGGDEFLCAMSNVTMSDARERFRQVAAALAAAPGGGAISAGFAELAAEESASELIARADSELLGARAASQQHR